MPRNVEIKARLLNPETIRARVEAIAGARAAVLLQEDVFFPVPEGRLKLRYLEETRLGDEARPAVRRGELIFYERPDQPGPKTSHYSIFETDHPEELASVLSAAYGTRATVKKRRDLYFVGRTRVHLDEVEGLGHFLELEVVLGPDEEVRAGEREANRLLDALGVPPGDLVTASYVDLLGGSRP